MFCIIVTSLLHRSVTPRPIAFLCSWLFSTFQLLRYRFSLLFPVSPEDNQRVEGFRFEISSLTQLIKQREQPQQPQWQLPHMQMQQLLLQRHAQQGQVLHATAGGISPQVQARSQQLSGSTPDIKPDEINPVLNPRAPGPEGSNQGGNNLTLKRWPLKGLDELRSGILQQQKSPSASEDSRRLRMLLRRKHEDMVKDGYEDITNIDISLVVVDMMRRKHEDIP